jgi:cbb3-type cytochrome oxidase subunit 3
MKKLALLLLPLLTIGTFVFAYTAEQKEAYDWAYSR